MITHPAIAQQFAAERQRDLLDHASRHRQARAAHHRHLTTAARLRWITAALAAAALGLLAWAAAAPAAFAQVLPPEPRSYGPVPATTVRVIAAGGTPGWQITVIAVAAALIAAVAAVLLDRARASRRSASSAG